MKYLTRTGLNRFENKNLNWSDKRANLAQTFTNKMIGLVSNGLTKEQMLRTFESHLPDVVKLIGKILKAI